MRILIIGAGVIGVTYAWQFSNTGYDVSVYVKKEKQDFYIKNGFIINSVDLRDKKKIEDKVIYKPKLVTEISSENKFDLIIVAVQKTQLNSVISILKNNSNSLVMFFSNNWIGVKELTNVLNKNNVLFGFPHMVGGGRKENVINSIIFGGSSRTMLGEIDGKVTERLLKIKEIFDNSNMKAKISRNIIDWLITHYIQQSSGIGIFLKYENPRNVLNDKYKLIEMCLIAREGLNVCKKMGIKTKRIFPINFIYLPKNLVAFLFKKMFESEDELAMIEGHMEHGINEMIYGFYEVLKTGEQLNVDMPLWKKCKKYVDYYVENTVK